MLTTLKKFWNDERGFVNSAELILVATLAVLGLIVGLATLRDSISFELGDTSAAVGALDQSYSVSIGASPGDVTMEPVISLGTNAVNGAQEVTISRDFQIPDGMGGTQTLVRSEASFSNFRFDDDEDPGDNMNAGGIQIDTTTYDEGDMFP